MCTTLHAPGAPPPHTCVTRGVPCTSQETDPRTLEAGYDQVGTITVVIGEDAPPPQELALQQPVTPAVLSSALYLMKTFWTTPCKNIKDLRDLKDKLF